MTQLYRFRVGDPYFVLQTRSFKLLVFAASKSVDRNMLGKDFAPETINVQQIKFIVYCGSIRWEKYRHSILYFQGL